MSEGAVTPLAEVVRALDGIDPTGLDRQELLELIAGWEAVRSRVQACQNDVFVAYERLTTPQVDNSVDALGYFRWAADELGLVLDLTRHQAWRRVTHAVTLAEKLPQTTAALRAGRIGVSHAEKAADHAHNLSVPVSHEVEESVLADERWRTPSQLEKSFAEHIARIDPAGAADRANRARRGRGVRLRPEADGMATVSVFTTAADAALVNATVDAQARSSLAANILGDDRTLSERRADAVVELICRGTCAESTDTGDSTSTGARSRTGHQRSGPTRHGRSPQIHVTVAWTTLVGLDDLPADLTGYGPVDAATARRLAADPTGTWRRLLVDPSTGRLLDYGTTTYTPPQDLTDYVIARDTLCRFPGCEQPAIACDLDHRTPYGTPGGVTAPHNTDPVCRHHHRLKHEAGWTHHRDPETGESIWTTPDGRPYLRPAHVLPHGEPVVPPEPAELGPPPF